ncbi:MAG: DNA polymerase IV [Planctomycetota bacterium]
MEETRTRPEGDRAILHVDMDAFYASVEELDDPSRAGKPVIVGGPKDARGVVSAASYAARRYGVHSAMPLRTAARLCPHGLFLPVRMGRYLEVSRQVFAILDRFSPQVEKLSVDEAFLDLTGCERLFGGVVPAAERLRETIRAECRLTASVGVAPNKFVAKIASDLRKPDALVVVAPGRARDFLAPLPVERMWGVGPRGARALHRLGVRTFGDLAAAPPSRLRRAFGAGAGRLVDLARGRDARPVVTERAPRSVGHETTFPVDVSDPQVLRATLVGLCDRVASRLRRYGLRARVVTLKVRYAPFRTVTRRTTLDAATCTGAALRGAAEALLRRRPPGLGRPVRLLGVTTSGFRAQSLLFDDPKGSRDLAVERLADSVRGRFGPGSLRRGSVLGSTSG